MDLQIEDPPQPTAAGPLRRMLRRFRQTETGQALVEFTLVLPIFLLMLFALVDFGRAFHSWLILTNAAREGARVAATQQDTNTVQTRINNAMCKSYPGTCSLNMAKMSWSNQATANIQGPRGSAVTVELTYDFDYATPIGGIFNIVSAGTLAEPTITAHSSMRLE